MNGVKMLTQRQHEAITSRKTNICINANAGAGKTMVLIERIVSLLSEGIPLENILAITFTDKAAQEIKERLREALQKHKLSGDLDTAWISTIHGFCARVLREQWYVLGLSPQFGILSEAQAALLLEQAITSTIHYFLQQDNTDIIELLSIYKEKQLIEYCSNSIVQLMAGGLQPKDCQDLAELSTGVMWQNFCQAREKYLHTLVDNIQKNIQVLHAYSTAKRTEEIRQQLLCLSVTTATEYLQQLTTILDGFRASKAPANIDEQDHQAIVSGIKKIKEQCKTVQDLLGGPTTQDQTDLDHTKQAMNLVAEAYKRYQEIKRSANMLDYEDLQLKTLTLFQEQDTCKLYREKFFTIMLDEFQDTNPLQDKIFKLITKENNLCLVGDWKQSIYLFRNADVAIFRNYIETFDQQKLGKVIPLQENFRSSPALLSFVNEVCTPLFAPLPYEPLIANPAILDCGLPPQCIQLPFNEDERAEQIREREAQALAMAIRQTQNSGTNYKDMAILLRTFSSLHIYEQALKTAGIPYMVIGGRGYYQTPEIQDILQYLTLLNDPKNELALAAVLRSDIVGLADPTLVLLRAAAPHNLSTALSPEHWQDLPLDEQSRLTRFKKTFDELRHFIDTVSLPNLLSLIYEKTQYPTLVLSYPIDGPRMLANLNKLQEIALQSRNLTVSDFIQLITELVLKESREEEAPLLATENAVKIMTVHKSKGMQFNAVFLPALHQFNSLAIREGFLFDHKLTATYQLPVGIQYALIPGDRDTQIRTKTYLLLKLLRETTEQEETKRLFYVATTRAKEKLWLIHSYPENKNYTADALKTENWGSWLSYLLQEKQLRTISFIEPPEYTPAAKGPDKTWVLPEKISWEHFIQTHKENDITMFTVLEAATLLESPERFFQEIYLGLPHRQEEKGFSSARVGKIVHKCIEQAKKDYINELAHTTLSKAEQNLAIQCCQNYFASKFYQEYLQAEQKYAELACTYTTEGLTLVGRIDLAICSAGKWTILDFKTNQPDPLYEKQVGLYQEILAKALDINPESIEAFVYYLPDNTMIQIHPQNYIHTLATQIKKSGILLAHE